MMITMIQPVKWNTNFNTISGFYEIKMIKPILGNVLRRVFYLYNKDNALIFFLFSNEYKFNIFNLSS